MGVGVEAPGRDHHSTASSTEQGYNMANGYSSDDQRGGTAESYQGKIGKIVVLMKCQIPQWAGLALILLCKETF